MQGHISEELVTKQTGICRTTQHFSYDLLHERYKFPLPVDPYAERFCYRKKDYNDFLRHMINDVPVDLTLEMKLGLHCQAMEVIKTGAKSPLHLLHCYLLTHNLSGTEPNQQYVDALESMVSEQRKWKQVDPLKENRNTSKCHRQD